MSGDNFTFDTAENYSTLDEVAKMLTGDSKAVKPGLKELVKRKPVYTNNNMVRVSAILRGRFYPNRCIVYAMTFRTKFTDLT